MMKQQDTAIPHRKRRVEHPGSAATAAAGVPLLMAPKSGVERRFGRVSLEARSSLARYVVGGEEHDLTRGMVASRRQGGLLGVMFRWGRITADDGSVILMGGD